MTGALLRTAPGGEHGTSCRSVIGGLGCGAIRRVARLVCTLYCVPSGVPSRPSGRPVRHCGLQAFSLANVGPAISRLSLPLMKDEDTTIRAGAS